MGRKCFVSGCKSGYDSNKEKVSIFSVPKDEESLNQWREVIQRKDRLLGVKDCICEKHFREDDIIRTCDMMIPLQVPRLKKGACPIFPLNNNIGRNKKFPGNHEIFLPLGVEDKDTKNFLHEEYIVKEEICVSPSDVLANDVRNINGCLIKDELETNSVKNEDEDFDVPDEILISVVVKSPQITFENLWNGEIKLDEYQVDFWTQNRIKHNGNSFVVFIKNTLTNDAIPIAEKQILIDTNLHLKFIVLQKKFENIDDTFPNTISTVEVFKSILRLFNRLTVCSGGHSLTVYPDREFLAEINESLIDEPLQVWRHRSCSLLLRLGKRCDFCKTLMNDMYMNKSKIFNKYKRIKSK